MIAADFALSCKTQRIEILKQLKARKLAPVIAAKKMQALDAILHAAQADSKIINPQKKDQ